tara:strand:+ start:1615 stop:2025 length:411 start_codon:yes stop_codon:yes gene_type:complete
MSSITTTTTAWKRYGMETTADMIKKYRNIYAVNIRMLNKSGSKLAFMEDDQQTEYNNIMKEFYEDRKYAVVQAEYIVMVLKFIEENPINNKVNRLLRYYIDNSDEYNDAVDEVVEEINDIMGLMNLWESGVNKQNL